MRAQAEHESELTDPVGQIRSQIGCRHPVEIWTTSVRLDGYLELPRNPRSLVIIANGDGDHTWDNANARVAALLADAGFATLVVNLLTRDEAAEDAETSALRFDARFLAERLVKVTRWAKARPALQGLSIEYLARGLCAGAALAAAAVTDEATAVVCCAARVELASIRLDRLDAAVLFLVGDRDVAHIGLNIGLLRRLHCEARLELVRHGTHLLDDAAACAIVAREAASWFARVKCPAELAG
jgi:dienelactone hydrolase